MPKSLVSLLSELMLLRNEKILPAGIDQKYIIPAGNICYRLYRSLFRSADNHIRIVEALGGSSSGLSRQQIVEASAISDGGALSDILRELEQCGLISVTSDFNKRRQGEYYAAKVFVDTELRNSNLILQ